MLPAEEEIVDFGGVVVFLRGCRVARRRIATGSPRLASVITLVRGRKVMLLWITRM